MPATRVQPIVHGVIMGMFDSIIAACECGERLEFQSKSGLCECERYELPEAPADVMKDANRHSPQHCCCGNWLVIDVANRKVVVVPPPEPEGPLSIRLSDGKVLDFKRIMSEGGGQFQNYYGSKKCGEFDRDYLIRRTVMFDGY